MAGGCPLLRAVGLRHISKHSEEQRTVSASCCSLWGRCWLFCLGLFVLLVMPGPPGLYGEELRYIVVFRTGTPVQAQTAAVAESGSTVLHILPLVNAVVVKLPVERAEAALALLRSRPEVVELHADAPISQQGLAGDESTTGTFIMPTAPPVEENPWNFLQIGFDPERERCTRPGVWVAVLDTGIDTSHPGLARSMVGCYNARAGEPETDCLDRNGHGTHMAGIIAANMSGVKGIALGARLVAVRVLDSAGGGYVSDLINGLSWVYNQPQIKVVNMSLGFYKGGPYPLLHTVVQRLYEAGVILVAAVGNYKTVISPVARGGDPVAAGEGGEGEGGEGEGGESVLVTVCIPPSAVAAGEGGETTTTGGDDVLVIHDPACNGQVKFPARYPETIAVGATDTYGKVAYYSITGPQVDIVAPGGTRLHSIISTTTRFSGAGTAVYGRGSGTSQATAHVTGLVVRMLEENPWLTPDEVRMILWETAKDLGVSSMAQGGGLIQVRPALTRASQWGSQ